VEISKTIATRVALLEISKTIAVLVEEFRKNPSVQETCNNVEFPQMESIAEFSNSTDARKQCPSGMESVTVLLN
jgi:hypothetical protein